MAKPQHPIYNIHFGLVCLSSMVFSASYNMLLPELSSYLASMHGEAYLGLPIALFTLTAGISRPFSGRLTDTLGRVPVMAVGSIVCFICGFLYPLLATVFGFLFVRLIHGFSTGFKPTATAAYVADIVPQERWGEALGMHGLFFSTGMAIGPAIGSAIRASHSLNTLFYTSSFFALMSIVMIMNMKETLKTKQKFSFSILKISRKDIIAVEVLPAAIVTFITYISYGAIVTLVPDWSHYLGIPNKGLFFMVFTIASLVIRFVAGKLSDKYGRIAVIKIGLVLLVVALVIVAYADTIPGLMLGAIVYGVSNGILSPALNAWTVDMSHPEYRGKGMATMYISLEAGIGLGAFLSGLYYHRIYGHIPYIIYGTAAVTLTAIAYMFMRREPAKKVLGTEETEIAV